MKGLLGSREYNTDVRGEGKGKTANSYRGSAADIDRSRNEAAAVIYPIQDSGVE